MQNNNDLPIVYLDEDLRNIGADHLEEYRNSCFYNLLMRSIKERGSGYERVAAKLMKKLGYKIKRIGTYCGETDLDIDGQEFELKGSRKSSTYDSKGRLFQFSGIKSSDKKLLLLTVEPNDVVTLYKTSFNRIKKYLGNISTDRFNLTITDPSEFKTLATKIAQVQYQ